MALHNHMQEPLALHNLVKYKLLEGLDTQQTTMAASIPFPTTAFSMDPSKFLPSKAIIFEPDCQLLAAWQGVIDPTNTIDSYAFYSRDNRVLVYIHSSAIDIHEIFEIIAEGTVTPDTKFVPDKAITYAPTQHVPPEFYADTMQYALKMLVGSDEMVLDAEAFKKALTWLHPSLHEAHPLLNKRHAMTRML